MIEHEDEPFAVGSRLTHVVGAIVGKQLVVFSAEPGVRAGSLIHDPQALAQVDNSGELAVGIIVCVHVTKDQHEKIAVMLNDEDLEGLDHARAELRRMRS